MGNKLGRTRVYEYSFPERLINLMSKGYLNARICREFQVSEDIFYKWVNDHPDFSDAYKFGLTFRKAYYFEIAQNYLEGKCPKVRESMLRDFLSALSEEFKKPEKTTSNQTITNVNIQNMQVLNRLDRPQLIQRAVDLLQRTNIEDVIDVDSIESAHSSGEADSDEQRRIEVVNSDSTDS
jgi:hypothetical protein